MSKLILKLLIGAFALTFYASGTIAEHNCTIATHKYGPTSAGRRNTDPFDELCKVTPKYLKALATANLNYQPHQHALAAELQLEINQNTAIDDNKSGVASNEGAIHEIENDVDANARAIAEETKIRKANDTYLNVKRDENRQAIEQNTSDIEALAEGENIGAIENNKEAIGEWSTTPEVAVLDDDGNATFTVNADGNQTQIFEAEQPRETTVKAAIEDNEVAIAHERTASVSRDNALGGRIDNNSSRIDENKEAIEDAIALAAAMPDSWLSDRETFAISVGGGFTEGAAAFGAISTFRFTEKLTGYAGGASTTDNTWSAKGGVRVGW